MTDPEEELPFRVQSDGARWRVVDREGNVLVTCGDAANAGQYAALMNQAYRHGYKAGFRNARRRQK